MVHFYIFGLMRPFRSAIIFGLLFLSLSCTFQIDEVENFVDVKPVLPEGTVSLLNYDDGDTIYLTAPTNFSYKIDVTQLGTPQQVKVYYDNTEIVTTQSSQGQFYISSEKITTGTHKLKIDFQVIANTGSLASQYNLEVSTVSRSWVIIVDIDLPPPVKLTKSVENGFLKISWPKYEKANFLYYEIYFNSHPTRFNQTIRYTNASHNYFIDSTYLGGDNYATYSVTVQNKVGGAYESVGAYDPQELTGVFHPEDTTIDLKWRKAKYSGTFKSFVITQVEGSTQVGDKKIITSPTDTTLRCKLKAFFPRPSTIAFEMFDKLDVARAGNRYTVDNPAGVKRTDIDVPWVYNQTLGKVLGRVGAIVKIYDSQMEAIGSIDGPMGTMPWPGTYTYYVVPDGIAQRNLVTGEIKTRTTFAVNTPTKAPSAFSAASNGLINYEIYDLTFPFDRRHITGRIDMSTQTILKSSSTDYDPKTMTFYLDVLSDDGRYMYRPQYYFSVSGATETSLGSNPLLGYFVSFRPDNCDEVLLKSYVNGSIVIMKTTDQTELRTIAPPETGFTFRNYDPASKYILFTKDNAPKTYLVHIETGAWKLLNVYGYSSTLVNGYLIDQSGYYFKAL